MTSGIGAGPRTVVLVSGSGTNLQAIIDAVAAGSLAVELVAVLSDKPEAFGLERARRAGIPDIAVGYNTFAQRADAEHALAARLASLEPDIVVLAGFMRILPASVVEAHTGRMLNIHPSLLPKFRGLHTYRRALEAGETWHGSTVHFVTPELDAGPALIQYRVRIAPDDTEDSLAARVQQGEYRIYPRAIDWVATGRARLTDAGAELDGAILAAPVIEDELPA